MVKQDGPSAVSLIRVLWVWRCTHVLIVLSAIVLWLIYNHMSLFFFQLIHVYFITEAACKTHMKQQRCQSAMKWNNQGIAMVYL
jgi:hypothetical protein